jgi:dihydroneopterin aldolase
MPNEPNPLSDRIHIEQLEVSARIGVPEEERSTPQRLTVSISFWPYHEQHYAGSVYHRADVALSSARHLRGAP